MCDILAFYCGEDFELIDALFCKSKLYREKWNREDYKYSTIKKAIAFCKGKFYKNGVNFRMLQKIKNGKHCSLDNLTFGVTFAKN